ncbi:MAG: Nif3-like dinuclear metal center hexameric protein [Coriobacteriia bacterium]|nr:Nif3-like dinuclear metal center hexameric protein [Coriobacteriia bacterium]
MSSEHTLEVRDIVTALETAFPSRFAEEWDRVGLIAGAPETVVTGVLVTLDATAEAVGRAQRAGANLLVTHHPPFLEMPERVEHGPGPAGTLAAALSSGVAVASFHTSLDRAPAGADALCDVLGLSIIGPLESGSEPVSVIIVYVPEDAVGRVRAAMAAAGAGRIGAYEGCSFENPGIGRFAALGGADPVVRDVGEGVGEVRIEMVAPRPATGRVLAAARDAHPYEEPVVLATEAQRARGVARLGRVCSYGGADVGSLAAHVGARLGVRPRIWGDLTGPAARVAIAGGSAGSLLGDARAAADVLVAGEVRYHDALDAAARGLAIIEVGHDASEWPLVRVLAEEVRRYAGPDLPVIAETPRLAWQTLEDAHDRG